MHAASIDRSARLRRVAQLLADGREYSTLEVSTFAQVCAVNSCVAELRQLGHRITCERRGDRWYYRRMREDAVA